MARTSSLFDWTMPGILFLALAFRLIGLGYGLPFVYHQDEPIIVHHALAMGVDGLRAHFFVIPPFCSALLFFLYAAGYLAGRGLGRWDDADGFGVAFFNDPTYFYLAGRAVLGVMFGVLTVYAVYRLGRRHVSAGAGRYAALLLALTPMHVQQSHYIYADIPLALAVTLLLDRFLALMRKPTPAHYLAVGAILGWATAIKYTALYFLPIMAVAHALAWGRRSVCRGALIRLFAAGAACVLWFAVFAPSVVLNLRECFNQLLHQKGSEEQVGLWHHGVYSLAEGTGWLMMAAAVTGLVVLWKRPTTRASAWIFLSMICVYYGINVGFSQPFARYMMPLVPVIALAAAAGWASLPDGTKLARIGKWALAVLMTGELAVVSIYGDGLFLRTDTRTAAWEWVQQNVPAGAAVAVDNRFFAPPLKKTYAEYSEASIDSPADAKREIRRKRLYLESKSDVDERRYRVYTLWPETAPNRPDAPVLQPFLTATNDALQKAGVEYVILNGTDQSPDVRDFAEAWKRSGDARLEAVFNPYRNAGRRHPMDSYASTAAPHLRSELFSRSRLGPHLEIYKVERPVAAMTDGSGERS